MGNGNKVELVIITGMSGAGKTVAVQSLEDLGYFCVDNLPPTLLPKFLELMKENKENKKLAVVMDLRGREFFDTLYDNLNQFTTDEDIAEHILFLDANKETLVKRYKESRRSHPLAPNGLPLDGINQERDILDELKGRAQTIIDTSELTARQLREQIIGQYKEQKQHVFSVQLVSFGYKHGIPIDADLVFDVRFLPNPHYVESMRELTGLNQEVSSYVMKWKETRNFLRKLTDLLEFMLPQYQREGKSQLVIGIGCTGGQHRSVALAQKISEIVQKDFTSHVYHRDIGKGKVKKS
ncbi:RNase adapter RapZ [Alkalibacillus haloalkaliphilus]|uniref:RNase adapter RapZ n=1 Tax=Alkalibacillus haloalkaliphilus TaxID=94136 RepID=UPI002936AA10|nr:RNase adapter RapZ [Alkalibacillus haloalkaliphilus]MDV2582019.1 RNase adapter RapZ [Alkalibacillus haloalkaliphilus]